jgi:hypothetical protein
MKTMRIILGWVFTVMAAYAAVRGILLVVPALIHSGAETVGNDRLFQSGAIYLGISMEGMAIILGMLAYVCFRPPTSSRRQTPVQDKDPPA